jgi:phage baseplate assembly protein W
MASLNEVLGTDIVHKSDLLRSPLGDLDRISGLENMKMALFHRLVTSPGALAHRPNYGVGIKDYQNAPGSLSVYRRLAQRIQDQFVQDPRVQAVSGVRISTEDATPNLIQLIVRVKIVGYEETELKFTPFSEGV